MFQEVSGVARKITYEMTPDEAYEIISWARSHPGEPPVVVKHFLEPLFAVSQQREYGGH